MNWFDKFTCFSIRILTCSGIISSYESHREIIFALGGGPGLSLISFTIVLISLVWFIFTQVKIEV